MADNQYTINEKSASKIWTWDCPVVGCTTRECQRSGGIKPIKFAKARKSAQYHMAKFHPELDRHSGIVRKAI